VEGQTCDTAMRYGCIVRLDAAGFGVSDGGHPKILFGMPSSMPFTLDAVGAYRMTSVKKTLQNNGLCGKSGFLRTTLDAKKADTASARYKP
jgi:hypothetical protein